MHSSSKFRIFAFPVMAEIPFFHYCYETMDLNQSNSFSGQNIYPFTIKCQPRIILLFYAMLKKTVRYRIMRPISIIIRPNSISIGYFFGPRLSKKYLKLDLLSFLYTTFDPLHARFTYIMCAVTSHLFRIFGEFCKLSIPAI